MRAFLLALAMMATIAPAAASDESDTMATVQKVVVAFNTGNEKALLALCAPKASIIDDFPPYHWQGSTACSDWWNDFVAISKVVKLTDAHVTIAKPWHVENTALYAYIVVPTKLTYKAGGTPIIEPDAVWTFTLQKFGSGWRVSGLAWSQHHESNG